MEVLELLRRRHAASADSLAQVLGLTPNAVRQHLSNLVRDGLVRSEPVRHKRGRPLLVFSLTRRADSVFPKRYGQLATMILTELAEEEGPERLDRLVAAMARRNAEAIAPDLEGRPFEEKVQRLVNWVRRAGTLAELEEVEGGFEVSIRNCPFRSTALRFPQLCGLTPCLMLELLASPVSQSLSIHRGDPACAFVVHHP